MKYVAAILLCLLAYPPDSAAQVQDSTECDKYCAHMEQYFRQGKKNVEKFVEKAISERKDCIYAEMHYLQRHDSLVTEWRKRTTAIQQNHQLSDSAKVSLCSYEYMDIFSLCHERAEIPWRKRETLNYRDSFREK